MALPTCEILGFPPDNSPSHDAKMQDEVCLLMRFTQIDGPSPDGTLIEATGTVLEAIKAVTGKIIPLRRR